MDEVVQEDATWVICVEPAGFLEARRCWETRAFLTERGKVKVTNGVLETVGSMI